MSGRPIHNAPPTTSRATSSTGSTHSPADTALTGAALAFGKPKPPPKPNLAAITTKNGALIAASSSWAASRPTTDSTNHKVDQETRPPILPKRPSSPTPSTPNSTVRDESTPRIQSLPPSLPTRPSFPPVENPPLEPRISSTIPLPPPPRRSIQTTKQNDVGFASSAATFAARSPPKPNILPPPTMRRTNQYKDRSAQMLEPHFTDTTLADAIVGAHLAISRNPSPSPPRLRELPAHRKQLRSPVKDSSRSNSPKKHEFGLRETLRKEHKPSTAEPRGRSGIGVRRHPHKHHEGDKKRWREQVNEDEYKRYAGLWATNKGLLFSQRERNSTEDNIDDEICSVVARELWRRSRLPDLTLYQIWELVNERKVARLTKSQFIVGLWLIDQRLMGRKVPAKVVSSVWQSVDRFSGPGVKIRLT